VANADTVKSPIQGQLGTGTSILDANDEKLPYLVLVIVCSALALPPSAVSENSCCTI
jgi:hypothetical protein